MKNLQDVLKIEQSITTLIDDLKEQIVAETSEKLLDGVTVISKNICTVKLSNLKHNIWSPEYYLPDKQAEYVGKALEGISTAHSFISKVKTIIDDGFVKIGQNHYRLNDNTISVLKKYLGSID